MAKIIYYFVASMCFLNISGFLLLTIQRGRWGWLAISVFSAYLLYLVLPRVKIGKALGIPGFFLLTTLISHIVIGTFVLFSSDNGADLTTGAYHAMRHGIGAFVIVATAAGSFLLLNRFGADQLLKWILVILTTSSGLVLATPLLTYIYSPPSAFTEALGRDIFTRFFGTNSEANAAGLTGCLTAWLGLCTIVLSRRYMLGNLALVTGVLAAILSLSRTALITLGMIASLFILLPRMWRKAASILPALAASAGVIAYISLTPPERLPMQLISLQYISSSNIVFSAGYYESGRFSYWKRALPKIADSPLIGHGISRLERMKGLRCSHGNNCGIHNQFLVLWGESGIIPFASFILFFAYALWQSLALPRSAATTAVFGWMLIIAVYAMAFHGLLQFYSGVMFLLGLSCGILAYTKNRSGSTLSSMEDSESRIGSGRPRLSEP